MRARDGEILKNRIEIAHRAVNLIRAHPSALSLSSAASASGKSRVRPKVFPDALISDR